MHSDAHDQTMNPSRIISKRTGFAEGDVQRVLNELAALLHAPDVDNPGGEVLRFWMCFLEARKRGLLAEDRNFRISHGRVYLRWGATYAAYLQVHPHLYGRDGNSNSYTLALLRGSAAFAGTSLSLRMGNTRSSAYCFRLSDLPLKL